LKAYFENQASAQPTPPQPTVESVAEAPQTQYKSPYAPILQSAPPTLVPQAPAPPVAHLPGQPQNVLKGQNQSNLIPEVRAVKKRTPKDLKQIVRHIGMTPIDYKSVARDFKITISLLDLLQISPDFAKNVRSISTRVNTKKPQGKESMPAVSAAVFSIPSVHSVQSGQLEAIAASAHYPQFITPGSEDKAFRIPVHLMAIYKGEPVEVDLDPIRCIADQGSDINVITLSVVERLKLHTYKVAPKDRTTLRIGTADSKSTPLYQFAIIKVGVIGIWYEV
jgi:hypothetical protein